MTKSQESYRAFRPLLLTIAAVTGILFGACKGDDGDGYEPSPEIQSACEDYCAKAAECNDETDANECQMKCKDAISDCMVDEIDAALDKLNQCGNESCDDFIGCTINVGAQCVFGT